MPLGEVLVSELLAVDRFATSALYSRVSWIPFHVGYRRCRTHVATGEVTALKHELRNDAVELGASVAKALLPSAKGTEILSSLWDNVFVKVEVDTTSVFCDEISYACDRGRRAGLKNPTQWPKVGEQGSLT